MNKYVLIIAAVCCATASANAQSLEDIALAQLKENLQDSAIATLPLPLSANYVDTLNLQLTVRRNGTLDAVSSSWYWVKMNRLPDFDNVLKGAISEIDMPKRPVKKGDKRQTIVLRVPMAFQLADSLGKASETVTYVQENPQQAVKDYPAKANFYRNEYNNSTGIRTNRSDASPNLSLRGYAKRSGGNKSWKYYVVFKD